MATKEDNKHEFEPADTNSQTYPYIHAVPDDAKLCPVCGSQIDSGSKFCPICGCRINAIESRDVNPGVEKPDNEKIPPMGCVYASPDRMGKTRQNKGLFGGFLERK